jgi:hypothetical protein
MYREYNPNPQSRRTNDCVIRAIVKVTGYTWESTYISLAGIGLELADMMDANHVWGEFLYENGFRRYIIPNECPTCYTIRDFCRDYPSGEYILATGSHVVAVVDGDYYDSWDSGDEVPIYYWRRDYA